MQNKGSFHRKDDLGSLLGMLRVRARVTQLWLARLIGVSDKTIQNWENSTSIPKAVHLKRLIEAYLRLGTFTSSKEQAEAERLWQEAALNEAFDEEWFLGLQSTQDTQQPEKDLRIKKIPAPDIIPETKANAYQPIQSVFLFNEPLTKTHEMYGRARERETILGRTYKGASTSIVGQRRIGKTWLISYLRLVASTQFGSRIRVGYLDATAARCTTVAGFTARVLEELKVPHIVPDSALLALDLLERVVYDLKSKNQILLLCIDEFEGFSKPQEFTLDFFASLRAMTQAGLVLAVASRRPLIEIVGDCGKTSGFFNVFEQLSLEPFSREEAQAFVQDKSLKAGFTNQEQALLLKYGQIDEEQWPPLRLQLVGKMLLEDKILAQRDGVQYYRPNDPSYWQKFEQLLEEKYRGVVR